MSRQRDIKPDSGAANPELLRTLVPEHGRTAFVDEHPDTRGKESYVTGSDEVVTRRLSDKSVHRLVKVTVAPVVPMGKLREMGWHSEISRDGNDWIVGEARPSR